MEYYSNNSLGSTHIMVMEKEEEPPAESADTLSKEFDIIMGVWLPGLLCVAGIIGNILALAVLSQDRARCTSFYTLRALASSDVILLVCAMLQQVIPMFCIVTTDKQEDASAFCRHQGYIRVYAWPVICMAQMSSVFFTMLISTERFIAICFPLHASRICTIKKVRFAVISILAGSVLFNIPKFFEFQPEREWVGPNKSVSITLVGGTDLRLDFLYRYLYNTALFCLFMYIIPLTSLSILNFRIVQQMRRSKQCWDHLNRRQQREMKATVLPLCIVLLFFVSGTQSLIAFILDAVFVQHNVRLQIYTAVVNLLVILNSAANFLLMYLFGSKFRKMLKDLFSCKKNKLYNLHRMSTKSVTVVDL